MRKLLLALAFVAPPMNIADAAAGHRQKPDIAIPPVIVAQVGQASQQPQQPAITSLPAAQTIALILPADADGIIGRAAAGFVDECRNIQSDDNGARFVLYSTDSNPQQSAAAYQQAITDGADVVVGPMLRGGIVALLAQTKDAPVPTLLLQPGAGGNYYFLTAEAGREAAELAAMLIDAEAVEVLIVTQQTPLALRQIQGFSKQWRASGGKVPGISRPNESESGWQKLFDLLRDAAENERRIAVFAAGDAAFARRARHFTPSYHPVFAGSFGYDGGDFTDDIHIMAMPQMLTAAADDDTSGIVRRFRALGNDACYLALRAALWAEGFVYQGKSGNIVLSGNEFRRRGVLARLTGGRLQAASLPSFARVDDGE